MLSWNDFVTKKLCCYDTSQFWAVVRNSDEGFIVTDCATDETVCKYFMQKRDLIESGTYYVIHAGILFELYKCGRVYSEINP